VEDFLGMTPMPAVGHKVGAAFSPLTRASGSTPRYLLLHRHESRKASIEYFRERKVDLLVTDLGPGALPIHEVDFGAYDNFAIVFGNEQDGISDDLRQAATQRFYIPMSGFVGSVNLSVSCALTLYHLRMVHALEKRFSPNEQNALVLRWLAKNIKSFDLVLKKLGLPLERREADALSHNFDRFL